MSFNPLANGPALCVIGGGRMGPALAWALQQAGFPVKALVVRSPQRRQFLQRLFPPQTLVASVKPEMIEPVDLIGLAVPDDAVAEVAAQLATFPVDWPHKFVFHLSGVLDSSVLEPLSRQGATVFSWHPILSVSADDPRQVTFADAYADVEGMPSGIDMARKISTALHMHTLEVTSEQKRALHLAAVVFANFLVGVAADIQALFQKLELPPDVSVKPFVPLLRSTLTNLQESDPATALTGPVRRGDANTVRRHLQLLKQHHADHLQRVYRLISQRLLSLAAEAGLSAEARQVLQEVLTDAGSES